MRYFVRTWLTSGKGNGSNRNRTILGRCGRCAEGYIAHVNNLRKTNSVKQYAYFECSKLPFNGSECEVWHQEVLAIFRQQNFCPECHFSRKLEKESGDQYGCFGNDCDDNPEISDLFGVRYIPTAVLLDNGFPVLRMDGSCKSREFFVFLRDVISHGKDPLM